MKTQRVLIMGAGELGTALARVLRKKRGVRIDQWDKDPSRTPRRRPLADLVPRADFVLLAVPSRAMRNAAISIRRFLRRRTIAVSFAKGLEKTGRTMDEVLAATLPKRQPFAIVSGPMLAEELMRGKRGRGLCAATPPTARQSIVTLFRGTRISLAGTSNLHALALAGVLKNIYALALGIADGLGWSAAQKRRLTKRALGEMGNILATLARGKALARGAAGRDDLATTGYSKYSRNRLAGERMAQKRGVDRGSEGVVSLAPLLRLLGRHAAHFPLLRAIRKITAGEKSARETFLVFAGN
jgi:glycerol-3-phosphate dehydrogenase (NAD(P)+)